MPWLAGTALLHSLAVSEKRATFKAWTVLLALSAFSLSLLGTFLVRSGVLVSVHAFASDPTRGLFILGFLLAVIGSSLLLFAFKGSQVKSHGKHELWSRETLLLCNNIMLVAGLLTVLLGTLLPLVHKELGLGSISIGTPFFNHIYSWLIIPFALLLGVGPLFRWRRQDLGELKSKVVVALVLSLAAALLLPLLLAETFKPWAAVGIGLGAWIIVTSVQETWARATHKHSFAVGVRKLGNSHWAMILGHVGLAVSIIGIACTQNYSIEKDLRMQAGDRVHFADYEFVFAGIKEKNGPNYDGFKGVLEVHKQWQAGRPAQAREADVQGDPDADDRSGHRCRYHPRSLCGAGGTARQRCLGGADLLQAVRALDLVRRRLYGHWWRAGDAGQALPFRPS